MDLAAYLPLALEALDAVPESRLAVSLDCFYHSDDTHLTGLDLVEAFIRAADASDLTEAQKDDIARYRRAAAILEARTPLGGGVSYWNLKANIHDLAGSIHDLGTDGEARVLIGRLADSEPVLRWLIEDRHYQKIRETSPGHRGGPRLTDHLTDIQKTLDADPEGRLALSLDNFSYTEGSLRERLIQVLDYVRDADPGVLTGQLAQDVRRLQRATAIIEGRIELGGMTFANLHANVRDMMGSLSNFATTTEARDTVRRIVAAVPELRGSATDRQQPVPF